MNLTGNKKVLVILLVSLIVLIFPHITKGARCSCLYVYYSPYTSGDCYTGSGECGWEFEGITGPRFSCLLKTAPQLPTTERTGGLIGCYYGCGDSDTKCRGDACPDYSGWNGENCYLRVDCSRPVANCKKWPEECASDWACGQCGLKWDASNKECVECNCTTHQKFKKWGDTAGIYAGCDPPRNQSCQGEATPCLNYTSQATCPTWYGCSWSQLFGGWGCRGTIYACYNHTDSSSCNKQSGCWWDYGDIPTNYGACESACGAAAACDEKNIGAECGREFDYCSGYQLVEYTNNCSADFLNRTCGSTCDCPPANSPTATHYVPGECGLCRFNILDGCSNADGIVNTACNVVGNMWFNGDVDVAAPIEMRSWSTLDINGGKTLNIQDTITMEANSTINIAKGGKIQLTGLDAYILRIIKGAEINIQK